MRALREFERIEDRVLCALRCVDAATGAAIPRALDVRPLATPAPRLLRNRSGLFVVSSWQPLADHAAAFAAPPAAPAPGTVPLVLAISDPLGHYLPRLARVPLPRDPDPAAADGLFVPVDVPMFAAAAAPVGTNWALVRTSLRTPGGEALGGALLRVRRNGQVLARGLSDWRGEALVPVVGVPVTTFSEEEGAVVASEIEVALEAAFDPATGTRTPLDRVHAGRAPETLPLVDPVALESAIDALPRVEASLSIAARRDVRRTLTLDLP